MNCYRYTRFYDTVIGGELIAGVQLPNIDIPEPQRVVVVLELDGAHGRDSADAVHREGVHDTDAVLDNGHPIDRKSVV